MGCFESKERKTVFGESETTQNRNIVITHKSKIINIGYEPSHVNLKTEYLKKNGFKNSIGIIVSDPSFNALDFKELLRNSPNSLLILGGAMMQEAPELTKDLQQFIKNECPTVIWYLTTKADFPSNAKPPFSAELAA